MAPSRARATRDGLRLLRATQYLFRFAFMLIQDSCCYLCYLSTENCYPRF